MSFANFPIGLLHLFERDGFSVSFVLCIHHCMTIFESNFHHSILSLCIFFSLLNWLSNFEALYRFYDSEYFEINILNVFKRISYAFFFKGRAISECALVVALVYSLQVLLSRNYPSQTIEVLRYLYIFFSDQRYLTSYIFY